MPVAGAMAENATLFVVFNQSQAFLARYSPPPPAALDAPPRLAITNMLISAALAGAAASFVLTPVELVKCKMQVQAIVASDALLASAASTVGYAAAGKVPVAPGEAISKSVKSPGPIAITRAILAADGLKGLWLGQTGTFIRETGGSAAWFTTFEVLISYHLHRRHARGERGPGERVVRKGDLTAWELMSSGAAAGVIYNTVLFPADCIKSTIQTEDELRGLTKGGAVGRRSFMTVGKDIYRARGLAGLYQGCGLTALRAAPSSALIFYMCVISPSPFPRIDELE